MVGVGMEGTGWGSRGDPVAQLKEPTVSSMAGEGPDSSMFWLVPVLELTLMS